MDQGIAKGEKPNLWLLYNSYDNETDSKYIKKMPKVFLDELHLQ